MKVSERQEALQIRDEDFETSSPDTEWSPLPIDRDAETTVALIAKLEETVARVEAENGYAVAEPAERAFVLRGLKTFLATLKEDTTTSVAAIRQHALPPLKILSKRFGKAAIGIVVTAATGALVQWVTEFGAAILHALF